MRNLMGQVDGTVNPAPGTVDFDSLIWTTAPVNRGWRAEPRWYYDAFAWKWIPGTNSIVGA